MELDYTKKSVKELKKECKKNNIKNYSKKKKRRFN